MNTRQRDPNTGRYVKSNVVDIDLQNAINVHEVIAITGDPNSQTFYALNHDPYWDLVVSDLRDDNQRKSIEITNLQLVAKAKDKLLEDRRKLIDSSNAQIDALNNELSLSNRDVRIAVWVSVVLFCVLCWVLFGKEVLHMQVLGGFK